MQIRIKDINPKCIKTFGDWSLSEVDLTASNSSSYTTAHNRKWVNRPLGVPCQSEMKSYFFIAAKEREV